MDFFELFSHPLRLQIMQYLAAVIDRIADLLSLCSQLFNLCLDGSFGFVRAHMECIQPLQRRIDLCIDARKTRRSFLQTTFSIAPLLFYSLQHLTSYSSISQLGRVRMLARSTYGTGLARLKSRCFTPFRLPAL